MNVLQIMRQARFEIDALRTGNVVSAMWQDEEVLKAANVAMDRTARLLRLSGSEILTKVLKSTDPTGALGDKQIIEDYDPGTLMIVAGTTDYTLPSDFVRVASIRPITGGFDGIRFRPSSIANDFYVDLQNIPSDNLVSVNGAEQTYYYTIIGPRTIRFAPTPRDSFDIELTYHYRQHRLLYYNTGTVTRTNGLTSVSGSGTAWLTAGMRSPAELLVGVTSVNGVDMNAHYPHIQEISSDILLNLNRASTVTDGAGQAYFMAMVPVLPYEHHNWLAQMVSATLLRKVDADLSMKFQADLAQQLLEAVTPEVTLRQLQESLITEAFELADA